MTRNEYDELFEQLCYGHEAELLYNNKHYFLEWEKTKLVMYDITADCGKKVMEIRGENRFSIVDKFCEFPVWDGQPLNKNYYNVEIIDIE